MSQGGDIRLHDVECMYCGNIGKSRHAAGLILCRPCFERFRTYNWGRDCDDARASHGKKTEDEDGHDQSRR